MFNSRELGDLRADVRVNCEAFLARCRKEGLNVLITQTKRDDEYQALLYAQGRVSAGSIVTNTPYTSFHGAGLAFDFCKNVKGHEYDDTAFFERCGAIGRELGFTWGGDWVSFPDRPHLQWDEHGRYTALMLRTKQFPGTMPEWEEAMDISKLTDEQCYALVQRAQSYAASLADEKWAEAELSRAAAQGITDGRCARTLCTRAEAAIMALRAAEIMQKEDQHG